MQVRRLHQTPAASSVAAEHAAAVRRTVDDWAAAERIEQCDDARHFVVDGARARTGERYGTEIIPFSAVYHAWVFDEVITDRIRVEINVEMREAGANAHRLVRR